MIRVDAHHHVWDLTVRDQPWTVGLAPLRRSFGLEDLLPELAACDIDATVVVQTVPVAAETDELLELARTSEQVAGVVGWVDLEAPDVLDQLQRHLHEPGDMVGVRHQVEAEPDPDWLARPAVRRGLQAVSDAGLTYDLLVRLTQLPAAIDAVRRYPGLKFILDHAAKPNIAAGRTRAWANLMATLAGLPNVSVKLSGLTTEASEDWSSAEIEPYAELLLSTFGPSRMLFGSDWPVCLLAGSYSETAALAADLISALSPSEQAAVFGGNAIEWYSLGAIDRAATTTSQLSRIDLI